MCHKIVISKLFNVQNSRKPFVSHAISLLKGNISQQQSIQCSYSTEDGLITKVSTEEPRLVGKKVTVVGAGTVGLAAAFSILSHNISDELCLVDADENKIRAEKMDLEHAGIYLSDSILSASSNYAESANSSICIVTAGVRGEGDESRLELTQRNVELFKDIIPNLIKYSPEAILVIITNPVDVMSYVSWKLSGFPKNQVFGTGTVLDSARFRFFISQRLRISPKSVHALVIGEHGDNSVPIWSSGNVAGERLSKFNPKIGSEGDKEKWSDLHKDVVQAAYKIIKLKGYTSWSIGLVAGAVTSAILHDSGQVLPVSTSACGFHGIEKDVFLSLPCALNLNGIQAVINQHLTPKEIELLQKSAKIISEVQDKVKL